MLFSWLGTSVSTTCKLPDEAPSHKRLLGVRRWNSSHCPLIGLPENSHFCQEDEKDPSDSILLVIRKVCVRGGGSGFVMDEWQGSTIETWGLVLFGFNSWPWLQFDYTWKENQNQTF